MFPGKNKKKNNNKKKKHVKMSAENFTQSAKH